MTDLTPESPAVRLYAALYDYEPSEIDTTQSLLGFFKGQNLDLLAAEHERIVAERLAAVVAERDGALADCQHWRRDYTELQEKHFVLVAERDAAIAERERLRDALGYFLTDDRFQVAVGGNPIVVEAMLRTARAAINPEARS